MSDLTLNTDFEDKTRDDWMELVKSGLRGANFDTLIKATDDDIIRGPLSSAQDRPEATARLSRSGSPLLDGLAWHMCAPVRDGDLAFANTQLLDDLKGGASAIDITLSKHAINLRNKADLKRLLEGVYLDLVPIRFDIREDIYAKAALILESESLKHTPINLGLDPIGLSLSGRNGSLDGLSDILSDLPKNVTALSVNAARVHEAGGTEAQELSVMAASAASYWRRFGTDKKLSVRLASDQDGHLGIAKLRATRRIITRIAEVCGADPNIPIHSVTSLHMMQSVDPWTNLLRIMAAGFGAVCGGADYITLRPFTDAPSDKPRLATPFGYRIARNMQLMMMEESHLGQVADPAFGSYFHERLTEELAQTAWTEFQAIETGGGIEALIESGALKSSIAAAKAEREAKAAPILGVTLHPAESVKSPELREV